MQKYIALIFAINGFISAIIAAWYWWRASRLKGPEPLQTFNKEIPTMFSLMATQAVLINSGRLNAKAAIWTGAAAILSTIATVIGLA